jgi:hypothetical protein
MNRLVTLVSRLELPYRHLVQLKNSFYIVLMKTRASENPDKGDLFLSL